MATRPFLKGSFLAKGLLFLTNHRRTKTKMFVNAFHRPRLLCGLSVVRGNYKRGEQRMHQNGERRKTRGGGKTFLRPLLKRKEVRVGLGSQRNFVVPITSCSARIRMVWKVYQKKIAFIHTPSLPSTYAFLLYPISSLGRPALDA